MKVELRRKISAWVLLAVYLPMLAFSSIHLHTEQVRSEAVCHQCVSHQPHPGHISSQGAAHHVCVLCQFLTLPGLEALTTDLSVIISARRICFLTAEQPIVCMHVGSMRSRAPPYII